MDGIVDLLEWRHRREVASEASPPATSGAGRSRSRVAGSDGMGAVDPQMVARLEKAVERLHPLVERALGTEGRLQPRVETELLAIMGELTVGLVGEAAGRAERLAGRLEASR